MSTSCDTWSAYGRRRVQSFHYPLIRIPVEECCNLQDDEGAVAGRELAMQQELARAVEAARAEGFREGEAKANATAAEALERACSSVGTAVEAFTGERAAYFRQVEGEVVCLALAVARKVLHREVQMDPMLLAGVVRVALDQMQDKTRVVLRASPERVEVWRKFCQDLPKANGSMEVVAEESLPAYSVALEAEVGSTLIDLDSQLQEIESGFFDLLHRRPERSGE